MKIYMIKKANSESTYFYSAEKDGPKIIVKLGAFDSVYPAAEGLRKLVNDPSLQFESLASCALTYPVDTAVYSTILTDGHIEAIGGGLVGSLGLGYWDYTAK